MDYSKMKDSSQLVAKILNNLVDFIRVGMSSEDINQYCHSQIILEGAKPGCLGYQGFPKSVCISVNNRVCHGISSTSEKLKEGDLVSVDCCLELKEHFGDSCRTYVVGKYRNKRDQVLLETGHKAMWNAILEIKDGISVDFLGQKMESTARSFGFQTVKEFAGHGIGRELHTDPQIPFFSSGSKEYIK
jgi:methionyl aminopeptidase